MNIIEVNVRNKIMPNIEFGIFVLAHFLKKI
jgi:hypothetical protein